MDGGRMMGMNKGRRRRTGFEPVVRSNLLDLLVRPSVGRLYALLDRGEDTDMKECELADADRAYQHHVETCERLATKPVRLDRELA